jgi:hypothetical protein
MPATKECIPFGVGALFVARHVENLTCLLAIWRTMRQAFIEQDDSSERYAMGSERIEKNALRSSTVITGRLSYAFVAAFFLGLLALVAVAWPGLRA